MAKMTLKDVKKNASALSTLAGMRFPGKLRYAVAYNLEKLNREEKRIEEQRIELCRQYAEKDENGEAVMVQNVIDGSRSESFKMTLENEQAFTKEYAELLETEIDIDIRTVEASVVDRCDETERYDIPSVAQVIGMSFMIEG